MCLVVIALCQRDIGRIGCRIEQQGTDRFLEAAGGAHLNRCLSGQCRELALQLAPPDAQELCRAVHVERGNGYFNQRIRTVVEKLVVQEDWSRPIRCSTDIASQVRPASALPATPYMSATKQLLSSDSAPERGRIDALRPRRRTAINPTWEEGASTTGFCRTQRKCAWPKLLSVCCAVRRRNGVPS